LRLGSVVERDWESALEDILRLDSDVLRVARVSFWTTWEDPPRIFCELSYVAPPGLFERGMVLQKDDAGRYFDEIRRAQLIDAGSARDDPRTRDLARYLEARNIGALLDVPISCCGKLVGVLCHENVGGPREWTTSDQRFALAVGQALSAMLEARARGKSEANERRALFLSEAATSLAEVQDPDEVARRATRRAIPLLGEMSLLATFDADAICRAAVAHATEEGSGAWRRFGTRSSRRSERRA
jgi:GAF domain-containing protein